MRRRKKQDPVGPFSPPTPKEVEEREGLPMAVARDEATVHDAFMPTTASPHPMARRVARAYGGKGEEPGRSRSEESEMDSPEGFEEAKGDGPGFRRLKDDADEE